MSYPIAPHIKAAIDRYVETGCPLGGFLTAVMENNLMEAMGRADDGNKASLHAICGYVYMEIPGDCHGSQEKVEAWYEKHAEERRQSAPALQQQDDPHDD
jgi:hypothetical protein